MEPAVSKSFKLKWMLWLAGIILFISITIIAVMGALIINQETLYNNIFVESVEVGSLTKEEALKKLTDIIKAETDNLKVHIVHGERNWSITYSSLGYSYNLQDAIDKAYAIGRKGSLVERLKEINSLRKAPVFISMVGSYEENKLQEFIEKISHEIQQEPSDATISRKNGRFILQEEIIGYSVNEGLLKERITSSIAAFSSQPIEVPTEIIIPDITSQQLSEIRDVLGEFKTTFDAASGGRATNIGLASKSINGILLMPSEGFSFNQATGPRGLDEGYQMAPVIMNGKLVPGIGGGICQVSTTLYNALIRADLEIVRRQNHSLPVAYVPLGHDATVADGNIDLQFLNNTEYPIFLVSYVDGNQLYVGVYGKKTNDITISLESKVVETIEPKIEVIKDPNMVLGERRVEREAKRGYRVNTYKIYYQNGKEIKREEISRDYYFPVKGIVYEGSRASISEYPDSSQLEDGEEFAEEVIIEEPSSGE